MTRWRLQGVAPSRREGHRVLSVSVTRMVRACGEGLCRAVTTSASPVIVCAWVLSGEWVRWATHEVTRWMIYDSSAKSPGFRILCLACCWFASPPRCNPPSTLPRNASPTETLGDWQGGRWFQRGLAELFRF